VFIGTSGIDLTDTQGGMTSVKGRNLVNFPVSFPTAVLGVAVSADYSGNSDTYGNRNLSNSGYQIMVYTGGGSEKTYYIAVGY
jgi:hypothetical protein